MIKEKQVKDWLMNYASLYEKNDFEGIVNCYTVPSTMSTPVKVVIMETNDDVQSQVREILALTSQSQLSEARVRDLSVLPVNDNVCIANCRWVMVDKAGEAFAEFSAVYQLAYSKNEFRIVNVTSYYHD